MYKYFLKHSYKSYEQAGNCFKTITTDQEFELTRKQAVIIVSDEILAGMEYYASRQDNFGFSDFTYDSTFLGSYGFDEHDRLVVECHRPKIEYLATFEDGEVAILSRSQCVDAIGEIKTANLEDYADRDMSGYMVYRVTAGYTEWFVGGKRRSHTEWVDYSSRLVK